MDNVFTNLHVTRKGNGLLGESPLGRKTWIPLLVDDMAYEDELKVEFEDWSPSDDGGLVFLSNISKVEGAGGVLFERKAGDRNADEVELPNIEAMVNHAVAGGAKQIIFRLHSDEAGFVRIHLAGPRSKHHGDLIVKDAGEYPNDRFYGVVKGGVWSARAPQAVIDLVKAFDSNPAAVAKVYAEAHSNCCFCSKDLTDERSIYAGYGPTCAAKYCLPWGELPGEVAEPECTAPKCVGTGHPAAPGHYVCQDCLDDHGRDAAIEMADPEYDR